LIRLAIRVRPDRAEIALAELLPVLGGGAEERAVDGCVEYATYGLAGELPADDEIRALAPDVVAIGRSPVAEGWERRWHEFLRPVRVGALVIRPPWLDGSASDMVIDPGDWFGAGGHPTTRLCLALLQELPAGGALCDWGAGSGVLAVAAARLGWDPVTAIEVEQGALEAIRGNAARNGVAVEARRGDVTLEPPWAPTVVANLPKPVLLAAAAARARPGGRVIAAGMLAGEADEVVAAFGLRESRRAEEDGWAAVVLT
jgi:ribosomal protein L11 methyltransferase